METVATRVAFIVREFHGDNVLAAAAFTGLPQPTLRRIVKGLVDRPQKRVIETIADRYGTTSAWLLRGEGKPPERVDESGIPYVAQRIVWEKSIDALGLDANVAAVLKAAPAKLSEAEFWYALVTAHARSAHRPNASILREAVAESYSRFNEFLNLWVRGVGRTAIVDGMSRVVERLGDEDRWMSSTVIPRSKAPAKARVKKREKRPDERG